MIEDPTSALEQEIRRLPRIGKAPYLPTVKKYLDRGADPNAEARFGKKSIMVMILDRSFPISSKPRWEILPLLIEHGGNPLLHGDLLMGLIDDNSALISSVSRALADRQVQEQPCLGANGANLMHLLLQDSRRTHSIPWAIGRGIDNPLPRAWLSDTNDHGQTPLHILWQGLNSDYLVPAWELTQMLVEWGGTLDTVDRCGESVKDVICKRLASVDTSLLQEEHPDVQAHIEAWLLQQSVRSPVASMGGMGRRL